MNKKYLCIQILSRDSVTVSVDAVVYFNVIDAELALCSVDDFRLVATETCPVSQAEIAEVMPEAFNNIFFCHFKNLLNQEIESKSKDKICFGNAFSFILHQYQLISTTFASPNYSG